VSGPPTWKCVGATEAIKPFRQFTGSCIQTINILPLQDCICRRLEKQGRQDGRSDQPQPTVSLSHLLGEKTEMNVEVYSLLKTMGNTNFGAHEEASSLVLYEYNIKGPADLQW